ncbi:hypothetical protein AB1Y20_004212 [Prymnesium parvum]|uniref:FAD-dependent oxidoreductase domain-containing protein 1 n=1 Tax=Prymnesium parvum TaxID=97485 RepID=A0AB34J927_PRYPA
MRRLAAPLSPRPPALSSALLSPAAHLSGTHRRRLTLPSGAPPSGELPAACDVLIIGGGVVGNSVAYHLAHARGTGDGIVVVERDPTYKSASAVLSAGGIRQQFGVKENVQMSVYGAQFVKAAPTLLRVDGCDDEVDLQFQERGYLFLASSEAGRQTLLRNHETQRAAGVDWMRLLSPTELSSRFPWLTTDDVVLGSLGTANEGWFDPWALLRGLRRKAASLGVKFLHGRPVGAARDGPKVAAVDVELHGGAAVRLAPRAVVNAAGAHARHALDCLSGGGVAALPVSGRKRCIFHFRAAPPPTPHHATPLPSAPLVIDASGVYFRPEGRGSDTYLCGVSPDAADDEEVSDPSLLTVGEAEHSKLFDALIWPALYERVEAFGALKVQSSWAGLYEYNTLDQNALIGWHPQLTNLMLANGFSGHGLQHSPAAGRAVAELIDHGRFVTLDLEVFSFDRIARGELIYEPGIV